MDQLTVFPVTHHRYAWVVRVPWLPDSAEDHARYGLDALERGYLNLAQTVANSSDAGSALQLRILAKESKYGDEPGLLSAWVVGAATSDVNARRLWDLAEAALPSELPLEPGGVPETRGVIGWVSEAREGCFVEVRRRIEDAFPLPGISLDVPAEAAVLRWEASPNALRTAMTLLQRQPGRSCLVLHMEPAAPSEDLLLMLSDRFQMAIAAGASAPAGGEYGPLLHRMANEARYRMRLLPRAALNVRIGIASTEVIRPGVAEAVGMDFTAPGGFELVRPSGQIEASDAIGLLTEGEARNWAPIGDPVTGELRYICDPVEAASLVRFPMLPSGGVPGMNSIPMVTLPKSPQAPAAGTSIRIGRSPYGGAVELTLRELNQHCLIAGLPGFGKTNTSHTILRQLWNEHGVPFLVLDPAKADYGDLIASLSIRGDRAPQRIVLGPESVAFNPFVVPAGSSVAAHAGRVLGAFDAALQISAQWPMGYIMLSRAVFRAYEEKAPGESPTLRSVYAVLGDLIRSTPMDPKSKADVSASLLGRIEYMARGPLGAALAGGPDAGIDWNDLLSRPTVVEFRGFAGPTERSLIFGLLIAGLASVRENEGGGSELRHLTVLEEAHRVLSNRSLVEAEGVRLLAEAIAELRGSGEGFMVIDQTPTALHPTIRKVCGSVVGHRLVEAAEREAVGSALLLEARQRDDLARLPVGRAVVYGAERSTSAVVEVDRAPDVDGRAQPSTSTLTIGSGEPLFCVDCTAMCLHRAAGERIAQRVASERKAAVDLISEEVLASVPPDVVWCGIAHSVGADASTQGRTAVFSELKTLRSALVEVLGKMRMQAKAGASGLDSDLAPAASE